MKLLTFLSLAGIFLLDPASAANIKHEISCEIVEEEDKIIRCTFTSTRLVQDRNITFVWRSETTPQDDRERTFTLPARHGSVYDYRYFFGRAPGKWNVSAISQEGQLLATTSFNLE